MLTKEYKYYKFRELMEEDKKVMRLVELNQEDIYLTSIEKLNFQYEEKNKRKNKRLKLSVNLYAVETSVALDDRMKNLIEQLFYIYTDDEYFKQYIDKTIYTTISELDTSLELFRECYNKQFKLGIEETVSPNIIVHLVIPFLKLTNEYFQTNEGNDFMYNLLTYDDYFEEHTQVENLKNIQKTIFKSIISDEHTKVNTELQYTSLQNIEQWKALYELTDIIPKLKDVKGNFVEIGSDIITLQKHIEGYLNMLYEINDSVNSNEYILAKIERINEYLYKTDNMNTNHIVDVSTKQNIAKQIEKGETTISSVIKNYFTDTNIQLTDKKEGYNIYRDLLDILFILQPEEVENKEVELYALLTKYVYMKEVIYTLYSIFHYLQLENGTHTKLSSTLVLQFAKVFNQIYELLIYEIITDTPITLDNEMEYYKQFIISLNVLYDANFGEYDNLSKFAQDYKLFIKYATSK